MLSGVDRSWRTAARGSLAILLMACLVACNDQPDQPANTPAGEADATAIVIRPTILATSAPSAVKPADTPQPTATPLPARPVVVQLGSPVDSLHPFYAASPAARTVLGALFAGCVGEDEQGRRMALGCEQVPSAENGAAVFIGEGADRHLQATFRIRPGWRWTDGKPVTAPDAIYAWQLTMSPESGLRDPVVQQVFGMAASDERTVVVNFMSAAQAQAAANGSLRGEVPFEYFSQLGDYARFVDQQQPLAPKEYWSVVRWLPSHLLAGVAPKDQPNSDFARKPVGDGAFEIAEMDATRIVVRPSARAFPLGTPAITGIEFPLGRENFIQLDDAQVVFPDVPAQAMRAMSATAGLSLTTYTAAVEQLVLNVDRFPFDDVKVRQAVAHALNREALGQDAAVSGVAPTALPFDPARAAALLSEGGWACESKPCRKAITDDAGNTVTRTLGFRLTTTEREPRNVVAQAVQKQLAEAGFAVDVEIVFGEGRNSRLFASYEDGGVLLTRNFDAALYQVGSPSSVAGQFACAFIPTAESHDVSKGNASGFCDPEIDALIVSAESGEGTITASASQATNIALLKVQQAAPVVPLYEVKRGVLARGVAGLRPASTLPVTWNAWEWN